MPRRVQAPIETQADADLLANDTLPQPYRRIHNALIRIIDDAVDIAWRKQLEEEEASKKPSDQASHTLGPLNEFEGIESSVQHMLSGVNAKTPRSFFATLEGEFREIGEDGAAQPVARPDAHTEGATVLSMGGTTYNELEMIAALSSEGLVHIWKRAKLSAAPPPTTVEAGGIVPPPVPQLVVRASLNTTAPAGKMPEGTPAPFKTVQMSPDGRFLALARDDVVVVYRNPVPTEEPEGDGAVEVDLITGLLEDEVVCAITPGSGAGGSPDVWFVNRTKPRAVGAPAVSWCAELWLAWKGGMLMEAHSLCPILGGIQLVAQEGEEEVPVAQPHVKRWDMTAPITCSACTADGAYIATGLEDGATLLWDVRDGTPTHVFSRHVGAVDRVSFGPEFMVSIGREDRMLHIYSIASGKKTVAVEVPNTGVFGLQCFQEVPLALVMGARGPKLYDVLNGSVFAAFSTEDEAQVVFEKPSVHFGSELLTMMASKPAPPPPPLADGEEPPPEEEPPPADLMVPVYIETVRITNAYYGRPLSSDPTAMGLGSGTADWGQTSLASSTGAITKTMGRAASVTSRESISRPSQQLGAGTQLNLKMEPAVSVFDGFPSETSDMATKVTSFLRTRHGERRLRDIRVNKRQVAILEHMREAEA